MNIKIKIEKAFELVECYINEHEDFEFIMDMSFIDAEYYYKLDGKLVSSIWKKDGDKFVKVNAKDMPSHSSYTCFSDNNHWKFFFGVNFIKGRFVNDFEVYRYIVTAIP